MADQADQPADRSRGTHGFARNLAVIMAVDSYEHGIPELSGAVADARALAQALSRDHGYEVEFIAEKQMTRAELLSLFHEKLPQRVGPQDRLLVYFAGHGIALSDDDGPAGYLVPCDARPGESATFLSMREVNQALERLPCRHLLVILDCCFAGAFRWAQRRDMLARHPVIHKERFVRFVQDLAWQVLTSAGPDQRAFDVLALSDQRGQTAGHSPFAEALLDGLAGAADLGSGDGLITATELYLYVRDRVELGTTARGQRQTPGLWPLARHDKGEFLFQVPGKPLVLAPAPLLSRANNPYRGLLAYEEAHSDLFFGREVLTSDLLRFVMARPLSVVTGASGSGKSSLVKAGLVPLLRRADWRVLPPLRPGEKPLRSLAEALAQGAAQEALHAALQRDEKSLARHLHTLLSPGEKAVLIIDQTEETLTLGASESERRCFFRQLAEALAAGSERLRIVLTLREDFAPHLQELGLLPGWHQARFEVGRMKQNELREVIEQPAKKRVLFFEPIELIDQLINDVADMPGALPLLSFTLSELYLRYVDSGREDRSLREEDYRALAGVAGSLTERANQELAKLRAKDPAMAATARRVFVRMVATEGSELARRRVPLSELVFAEEAENQRVAQLLPQFIEARLLVRGQEGDREPYVEPAHDMLIRGWPELQRWRNDPQQQENLLLQRLLTPAAREWLHSGKQAGFLWDGNPRLPLLGQLLVAPDSWLNSLETDFVTRSLRRRRRNQVLRAAFIGLLVVLTVGAIYAALLARRNAKVAKTNEQRAIEQTALAKTNEQRAIEQTALAKTNEQRAIEQTALAKANEKRAIEQTTLAETNEKRAIRQTALAKENEKRAIEQTALAKAKEQEAREQTVRAERNEREANAQTILARERLEAVQRKEAERQVEEERKLAQRALLLVSGEPGNIEALRDALLSARGPLSRGQLTSEARQALVSAATVVGYPSRPSFTHQAPLNQAQISPDGRWLASAGVDGRITIWDLRAESSSARPVRTFQAHKGEARAVGFSPDGLRLVSAGADHVARVWDLTGQQRSQLSGHTGQINTAAFSPDGVRIVTASSEDGTVRVFRADSGQPVGQILREPSVLGAAFSPAYGSGERVGTISEQRTRLWNVEDGRSQSLWTRFAGKVQYEQGRAISPFELRVPIPFRFARAAAFSPDGRWLAAGRIPGQGIWLWELPVGEKRSILNEDAAESLAFSPNGEWLAAAWDRTTRLLHRESEARSTVLHGHDAPVRSVSFSPNGQEVVTAGGDGRAILWDVADPFTLRRFASVRLAQLARDGSTVALVRSGSAREVEVIPVESDQPVLSRLVGHSGPIDALALSGDGRTVLTLSQEDRTVRLWDVRTGSSRILATGEFLPLLALSAQGTRALTLSDGPNGAPLLAQIWNVPDGKKVSLLRPGPQLDTTDLQRARRVLGGAAEFSEQGERIVLAVRGDALVYDGNSGQQIRALRRGDVVRATLSRDGRTVALGNEDQTAERIDVQSATALGPALRHGGAVISTTLSVDGDRLLTLSDDRSATLWDASSGQRRFTLARIFPPSGGGEGVLVPRRVAEGRSAINLRGEIVLLLSLTEVEGAIRRLNLRNLTLVRRFPATDSAYLRLCCERLRGHPALAEVDRECRQSRQ